VRQNRECAAGLDCEEDICMPLCELGTNDCPDGAACTPRTLEFEPLGGRTVGVCPTAASDG
jgi:hypothetical protein